MQTPDCLEPEGSCMIKIPKTPRCYLTANLSEEILALHPSPQMLPLKAPPWKPSGSSGLLSMSCLFSMLCASLFVFSGYDPMGSSPPGSSVHGDSPGKNTGVGCHALLHGVFLTQGSNPGLPHCWRILYFLSHQGSPANGTLQINAALFFTTTWCQQTDWLCCSWTQACSSSSVQSLNWVWLFVTPWTAACQASPSITNSQSSLKLMSIESVMPSNHLILCRPLLLLPSIFPSIRIFSNESVLLIRWPKYWSFSFNISPSNEYSELISFRMDWLDLVTELQCIDDQFLTVNDSCQWKCLIETYFPFRSHISFLT